MASRRAGWMKTEIGGLPVWGMISALALVVTLGAVGVFASANNSASSASWNRYTPPPEVEPTVVAVMGDSYTTGTQYGGRGLRNWRNVLAASANIESPWSAEGGSGFLANGTAGPSFRDPERIATIVESEPDAILVVIAANDADLPSGEVASAAREVLSQLKATGAPVIVIGPIWRDPADTPSVVRLNETISAVAEEVGVAHVDAMDWFVGRRELIAVDGAHPTDEGHAYLAERIEAVLKDYGVVGPVTR